MALSSISSVGCASIVLARRQLGSDVGVYFSSLLELARQAAAVERGREVTRRFLGTGTPYTPQTVHFYGN